MGDGTAENPYTREDVLKLIEQNGGKAEGLDLSGKVFEEAVDLSGLDLRGIILNKARFLTPSEEAIIEGANLGEAVLLGANLKGAQLWEASLEGAILENANLEGADLQDAYLEGVRLVGSNLKEADFNWADLENADLSCTLLEGASLEIANLKRVSLLGASFNAETNFNNAEWGDYIICEEINGLFSTASETYRRLKIWHSNAGIYDIAGEFFYREMTVKRKAYWSGEDWESKSLLFPRKPFNWAWSMLVNVLCGYGERLLRVIGWAASVILVSALTYFIIGSVWEWSAFWNSLYFSAVSFTALGYGSWVNTTNDWIRGIGAFESFIGVFSIALFLVTFTRKMTR